MTSNHQIAGGIPASAGVGEVHIAVADGPRAQAFYQGVLGLSLLEAGDGSFTMGAGDRELVVLHPGAGGPVAPARTGLYHLAIVLPSLPEFARAVARFASLRYQHYPTDHILTKADYLWDPDGNGIEVYAETPEDGTWFMLEDGFAAQDSNGVLRSGRDPIDLAALYENLDPGEDLKEPMPPGTMMGHVHLHVRDLAEAIAFYHGLIGFDLMGSAPTLGMAFVSAGGYHHRLGLNTWAGVGASPAPPGTSGLRFFTVEVPDQRDVEGIRERLGASGAATEHGPSGGFFTRDPSENRLLVRARGSA